MNSKTARNKRIRFPSFETVPMHGDTFRAYTEYRGQPVTGWGHSEQEAEAKAREYIERHYAEWR